jgi:hypothetical protein
MRLDAATLLQSSRHVGTAYDSKVLELIVAHAFGEHIEEEDGLCDRVVEDRDTLGRTHYIFLNTPSDCAQVFPSLLTASQIVKELARRSTDADRGRHEPKKAEEGWQIHSLKIENISAIIAKAVWTPL